MFGYVLLGLAGWFGYKWYQDHDKKPGAKAAELNGLKVGDSVSLNGAKGRVLSVEGGAAYVQWMDGSKNSVDPTTLTLELPG